MKDYIPVILMPDGSYFSPGKVITADGMTDNDGAGIYSGEDAEVIRLLLEQKRKDGV